MSSSPASNGSGFPTIACGEICSDDADIFFNKRVSLVNYMSPETAPDEMLVDDSATTTVKQLGDALTELEVHGHFFGTCSLTLVLHGDDGRRLEQQTAEAMKMMAVHDGRFFEETYNLLNAWLAHHL